MTFSLRFAAAALVGLAATGLTGCDGVDAVEAVPAGPTVSFGATGATAAEGGQASIPVRLTNANGTPVTVEVLFAGRVTGGTRATNGTDFSGFGTERNGVFVATVSFAGTADETQTISFAVADDGILTPDGLVEPAEEAEFALQAPTNAVLGTPREFRLTIGTPPISSARARAVGDVVTVEGVVTRAQGRYVLLQDATAGIVVFSPNTATPFGADVVSGQIAVGDRVRLTGTLSEFQAANGQPGTGLLQINSATIPVTTVGTQQVSAYARLTRGNALPAPQRLTLAQIREPGDAYESEIVCVTGLSTAPGAGATFTAGTGSGLSYPVTDATATLDLRVGNNTETGVPGGIVGAPIPTAPFAFVGIVGQFRGTNQLSPYLATDVRASNTCS